VADWIGTLEKDHEGKYVVAEDYYMETYLDVDNLDRMRFDEEGVRTVDGEPAVKAALNRPMRGEPLVWRGTEHARPESFEDTGECLYRQFAKLRRRNGTPVFGGREELMDAFDGAYAAVHASSPDNPYTRGWRQEGVTSLMAEWVCKTHDIPLQVLWKRVKVLEYAPEPGTTPVRYLIAGDHAVCAGTKGRGRLASASSIPERSWPTIFQQQKQGACKYEPLPDALSDLLRRRRPAIVMLLMSSFS
jgi:hypothetical protein